MDIGQRIKNARERAGLTQTALAQRLQIPQAYISNLENSGEKSEGISVRQVKRIAAQLGVDVIVLIEKDPPIPQPLTPAELPA